MRKEHNNITLLFLLITGLVIFSHSIIPHDHHYSFNEDKEHHDNEDANNHEPVHCYILNEIIVDKPATSSTQSLSNQLALVTFQVLFSIFELNNPVFSKHPFPDNEAQPTLLVLIKTSPTRGSPLFS
jgi:hypothetical protein